MCQSMLWVKNLVTVFLVGPRYSTWSIWKWKSSMPKLSSCLQGLTLHSWFSLSNMLIQTCCLKVKINQSVAVIQVLEFSAAAAQPFWWHWDPEGGRAQRCLICVRHFALQWKNHKWLVCFILAWPLVFDLSNVQQICYQEPLSTEPNRLTCALSYCCASCTFSFLKLRMHQYSWPQTFDQHLLSHAK